VINGLHPVQFPRTAKLAAAPPYRLLRAMFSAGRSPLDFSGLVQGCELRLRGAIAAIGTVARFPVTLTNILEELLQVLALVGQKEEPEGG
jgi:hypothetical protein